MPSTNQANTSGTAHESEFAKLVHKPDHVLRAVIDGLQSTEDCRNLISAEVAHRARKDVVARVNQRKTTLEDRTNAN